MLVAFVGFFSGVALASIFSFDIWFSLFFVLIGVAFFAVYFIYKGKRDRRFLIAALFILSFGAGAFRLSFSNWHRGDLVLDSLVNQKVSGEAVVTEEPDERDSNIIYTVSIKSVQKENADKSFGSTTTVNSKAIVSLPLYPRFQYGDRINFSGTLITPQSFAGNNGREFDYANYLAREDIFYQIQYGNAGLIKGGQGNPIQAVLFKIKQVFLQKIESVIPEPQSSLANGLLLGGKQSLGKELLQKFQTAGVIHVVVISGYNITIVAESIMRVLSFLPIVVGLSCGTVGIILFTLMTGASATVLRASFMAILALLARATGRTYQIARALAAAAIVMIVWNPKLLIFDPGFQLSFMATFSLIYISPILEPRFGWIPEKFGLRGIIVSTLSTQIFVLPIILYNTGTLSIVALLTNILILSFVPMTMLLSFLTGATAFISYIVAFPFGFAAHILLSYMLDVVTLLSSLPFAAVNLPAFSGWLLVPIYGFYMFVIFKIRNSSLQRSN